MSKQDRQGARTPAALEQKYRFGRQIKSTDANFAKQEKQVQQNNQELHMFMGTTNTAITDLKRRTANLTTLTSSMSGAIAALEEFAADTEANLLTLSENVNSLKSAVSGLQDDLTGIIIDFETLSASLEELRLVVSEHGLILSEHDASIADLIDRVAALESAATN